MKQPTRLRQFVAALLAFLLLCSLPGCGGASAGIPTAGVGTPASKAPVSGKAPSGKSAGSYSLAQAEYPEMKPYPQQEDFKKLFSDEIDYEKYSKAQLDWMDSINTLASGVDCTGRLDHFLTEANREFLSGMAGENAVWSPLNVWIALAMLAETTGGESREQLLQLLGMESLDQLRETANALWRDNYRDDGTTSSILTNSLWCSESFREHYQEETLQTLADQYYASSFAGDMASEEYTKALQDWVDQQTHGLLQGYARSLKLEPTTILALVSALYFKAEWGSPFDEARTTQDTFHAAAGEDIQAALMHKTLHTTYYWSDSFSAISLCFQDPSFRMWILLPDEGTAPEDLIASDAAMEFLLADKTPYYGDPAGRPDTSWENQKDVEVVLTLPKFDVSSGMDLIPKLASLGVTDIFNSTRSDFTPLTDMEDVFISQVQHAARVIADEEKVEAAAFTFVAANEWAAAPEDIVYFTVDRPFLFAITGPSDLPLFTGVVNHP